MVAEAEEVVVMPVVAEAEEVMLIRTHKQPGQGVQEAPVEQMVPPLVVEEGPAMMLRQQGLMGMMEGTPEVPAEDQLVLMVMVRVVLPAAQQLKVREVEAEARFQQVIYLRVQAEAEAVITVQVY